MLVDDEQEVLEAQSITLRMSGYANILAVDDSRKVLDILQEREIDIILLDLAMPHLSGEELLKRIKASFPSIPIIVITAIDHVDTAVTCMKAGAIDYMVKPIEKNRLVSGIQNALEIRSLRRRYDDLKRHLTEDALDSPSAFQKIVTRSEKMRRIFQYVESVARTDLNLLITGETGTGKELVAEAVHRLSGRSGELIPVNIAGLDDTMFSDTLFGHKKGAYTGATEARKGLLQQAGGGTLLIDEIGDLSPASQIKLLRLLEKGDYYTLGSDIRRYSSARIILAAQNTPRELLESGTFRKDLYYRISTHHVHLPPLRERKEDIPPLLHHFLEQACEKLGKERPLVPPPLYPELERYDFPGNVRELKSMVWDAMSRQSREELDLEPFREVILLNSAHHSEIHEDAGIDFAENLPTIKQATEKLISEALKRTKGNIPEAAHILGISRQALSKRLKRTAGE